jgi:hypothetical protein
VEPASAVPLISGWLSSAGEFGSESVTVGAAGSWVSTRKALSAGLESWLPAASVARTSNVRWPSPIGAVVWGDVQSANTCAPTRHSKLAPAGSSVENVNVGVSSFVGPSGPVSIVVSGGEESST